MANPLTRTGWLVLALFTTLGFVTGSLVAYGAGINPWLFGGGVAAGTAAVFTWWAYIYG